MDKRLEEIAMKLRSENTNAYIDPETKIGYQLIGDGRVSAAILSDEEKEGGWGDEPNTLSFNAYIPGHIFADCVTYNEGFGIYIRVYCIQIKLDEHDELEIEKIGAKDYSFNLIYGMDGRPREAYDITELLVSADRFFEMFGNENQEVR